MTWREINREWLARNEATGAVDMTEEEWLRCPLPNVMLKFLYAHPNGRKRRLFAVACLRRLAHTMPPNFLPFIGIAEDYAEGRISAEQLWQAWNCTGRMYNGDMCDDEDAPEEEVEGCEYDGNLTDAEYNFLYCVHRALESPGEYSHPTHFNEDAAAMIALTIPGCVSYIPESRTYDEAKSMKESAVLADLLRDIYNPFRPNYYRASWRTGEMMNLARNMYATNDFTQMAQLGEALRTVGCEDTAMLAHCQSDRPHVRGCWVIDVLLGTRWAELGPEPLRSS